MKEDKEREETKTRGRDLRHPRGRDKGIAAAPARFSKTTLACVCSANATHSHLSVCATYVPTTQPHPQPTQVRNLRCCKGYLMTTPALACGRGEQCVGGGGAFWQKRILIHWGNWLQNICKYQRKINQADRQARQQRGGSPQARSVTMPLPLPSISSFNDLRLKGGGADLLLGS